MGGADPENRRPVQQTLPMMDTSSQRGIRQRVLLEQIGMVLPPVLGTLGLTMMTLGSQLTDVVATFEYAYPWSLALISPPHRVPLGCFGPGVDPGYPRTLAVPSAPPAHPPILKRHVHLHRIALPNENSRIVFSTGPSPTPLPLLPLLPRLHHDGITFRMGEWTLLAVIILAAMSPAIPALSESLDKTADGLSKRDWLAKSFKLSPAELATLCDALLADTANPSQ